MARRSEFEVLASGLFDREHVAVHWSSEPRKTTPEIERGIEQAWTARLEEAQREDGRDASPRRLASPSHLYNGRLCRLIGARVDGVALHLELGPTDFRELVGTNLSHPEWFRSPGPDYLANALGVHAAVMSADDRIVVFRRSGIVAEGRGGYDVCGGHVELDQDFVDGRPDPFGAIAREIREEMGIAATDLDSLACLGLVRNARTYKPDLIFAIRANRSAEQMLRAPLADEHVAARAIGADPRSIGQFLARYRRKTTPAGIASLQAIAALPRN